MNQKIEESKTVNTQGPRVTDDNFDMTGIEMESPQFVASSDLQKQNTLTKTESKSSIMSKYLDNDGEGTIYYLKPRSSEIYLLNSHTNQFVGESLKW